MPSFDIMSEVDQPSLRNSVEVANSKIAGRHDFMKDPPDCLVVRLGRAANGQNHPAFRNR